jgi:hypothetical protein
MPLHVYISKLQLNGFGKTFCVSFPFIRANGWLWKNEKSPPKTIRVLPQPLNVPS